MQNKYFGDIGDFGKYGLLSFLSKYLDAGGIKLGINWYLVNDEEGSKDGRFISYLLNENNNFKKFRECDWELYDFLAEKIKPERVSKKIIIHKGERNVSLIEESGLFLANTVFYREPLSGANRKGWFSKSMEIFKECNLIFCDPDNGLLDDNEKKQKSDKHMYVKETDEYLNSGKSVIIYNHRNRKKEKEYLAIFKRLKKRKYRLTWHRQSCRDYVFLISNSHKKVFEDAIDAMKNSSWMMANKYFNKPHFTLELLNAQN